LRGRAKACLPLLAALACAEDRPGDAAPRVVTFGSPRRVDIAGYAGSAMEPFISCDGRYLYHRLDGGEFSLYGVERTDR
jgi:hypothetical protein